MPFKFEFDHLLKYTEWDRAQWEAWFREQGTLALAAGLGPNGDGRVNTVGELVRHIFAAELRYVQRVRGLPLMDASTVAADDVEALFAFGRQSRSALRALLTELPEERWDVPQEIQIGSHKRATTPKTMIVQAVTHEIRHWAQMATLLRTSGMKTGAHDFLVSGVFESRVSSP
jgi:uncharacterized damage-inducible protein DinB